MYKLYALEANLETGKLLEGIFGNITSSKQESFLKANLVP